MEDICLLILLIGVWILLAETGAAAMSCGPTRAAAAGRAYSWHVEGGVAARGLFVVVDAWDAL